MKKIAFISDIHGNKEALKATLEDAYSRGVDEIYCLGDIIAKGHHPNECIELVRKHCKVVIRGNTDEYFTKDHDNLDSLPELEISRIKWNQSLLADENKSYLRNLPFSYEFYLSGSLVRIFHAAPDRNNRTVLNVDSIDEKSTLFEHSDKTMSDKNADIVLYGHIHHQYMDKLYNKTLINIGSVGNAFDVIRDKDFDSDVRETTNAHYVILEGKLNEKDHTAPIGIEFCRVPYNMEKELEDVDKNLEKDTYLYELPNGMYRDMVKVLKGFKDKGVKLRKNKENDK